MANGSRAEYHERCVVRMNCKRPTPRQVDPTRFSCSVLRRNLCHRLCGTARIEMPGERAGAIVLDGADKGRVQNLLPPAAARCWPGYTRYTRSRVARSSTSEQALPSVCSKETGPPINSKAEPSTRSPKSISAVAVSSWRDVHLRPWAAEYCSCSATAHSRVSL